LTVDGDPPAQVRSSPGPADDDSRKRGEGAVAVRRLVVRNAAFATAAQLAGMPLSLLLSAITARYLGAEALGYLYLATTFNSFAFLAVDWGQSGALPALVATDRPQSGAFLGAALVWRCATSVAVSVLLVLAFRMLKYGSDFLLILALVSAGYALSAITNACQYAIMGFERTDAAARRQFFEQIVSVAVVIPILVFGGHLTLTLVGHAAASAIVLAYVWPTLGRLGVGRLSFDLRSLTALLRRGTPFVFLSIAMVLQPYIDALFMSKLASPEAVGWHAAARKLIGVLLFPAAALTTALYPTLCRLYTTDSDGLRTATTGALRVTTLLVVPVALGCALFPDVGVSVYGRKSFGLAEDNLRVLALFLFLVYFTMPLGTCLTASGKQRAWAIVQSLCVAVSLVLDPILVPWFQLHLNNGGLGVCWAAVTSEIFVLICGVALAPHGIFGGRFWRTLSLAMVSGGAMTGVARTLSSLSPFIVAPASVGVYVGTLWLTGGIDKGHISALRDLVRRKL
jgi:O-antigen/teichoic acid export membrane protein